MDILITLLVLLGPLFLLYFIGVPVALSIGAAVIITMISPVGSGIDYGLIANQLFYGINSFTLLAVPFYVLLGRIMVRTSITEMIFNFASSFMAQFRGGIAYVNIIASTLFAGMSGLAMADAAGLGRVEYQAMRDDGYDKEMSIGVTGSSAVIGPIIPPSVPIILYAVLAEQSIGELFIAGILPGILLAFTLSIFVFFIVIKKGYTASGTFSMQDVWGTLKVGAPALAIPILIIGGILLGYFTATEAGAVAVAYSVILAFGMNELTIGGLIKELKDSMIESSVLLFIILIATIYGLVALQLGIPALLAETVTGISTNPTLILLLLVVVFLVIGAFMSGTATIIILTPILMPVIEVVGIDPIHFGIVMILSLMISGLTPPYGMILFVLERVTDASLEEVIKGIIPYYIPMLIVILLIVFIPGIVLYLPGLI